MSGVLGPLLGTVLFVVVVPMTVVVVTPAYVVNVTHGFPWTAPWTWLGLVPLAAGAAMLLVCMAGFVLEGRGTPGPYDPPRRLVTGMLYSRVRNPMYVGVLAAIAGEAVVFASWALVLWAMVVFALLHLFVVLYEERVLRARFGAAYADYLRRVPRWIPR